MSWQRLEDIFCLLVQRYIPRNTDHTHVDNTHLIHRLMDQFYKDHDQTGYMNADHKHQDPIHAHHNHMRRSQAHGEHSHRDHTKPQGYPDKLNPQRRLHPHRLHPPPGSSYLRQLFSTFCMLRATNHFVNKIKIKERKSGLTKIKTNPLSEKSQLPPLATK